MPPVDLEHRVRPFGVERPDEPAHDEPKVSLVDVQEPSQLLYAAARNRVRQGSGGLPPDELHRRIAYHLPAFGRDLYDLPGLVGEVNIDGALMTREAYKYPLLDAVEQCPGDDGIDGVLYGLGFGSFAVKLEVPAAQI